MQTRILLLFIHLTVLTQARLASALEFPYARRPSKEYQFEPNSVGSTTPDGLATETLCVEWGDTHFILSTGYTEDKLRTFLESLSLSNSRTKYSAFAEIRWEQTATNPVVNRREPFTITNSFCPDGTPFDPLRTEVPGESTDPSNLITTFDAAFGGDTQAWKAQFAATFNRWSELVPITFIEVPDDGAIFPTSPGELGSRGDVRLFMHSIDGNSGQNVLGWGNSPSSGVFPDLRGDIVLDSDNITPEFSDPSNNYRRLRNLVMHEMGHGLGLSHVTVPGSGPRQLMEVATPFMPDFDGPQEDDIRGIQWLYGDAYEKNDSVGTSSNLGVLPATKSFNFTPLILADLAIEEGTATDYFRFDIPSDSRLNVEVAPIGDNYRVDPAQKGLEVVVGDAIHDLAFEVISPDGSTILASIDEKPLGRIENLVLCSATSSYTLFTDYDRNFRVDLGDLLFFHPTWYSLSFTEEVDRVDLNEDNVANGPDLPPLLADWKKGCTPALPAGTYYLRVFATTALDDVQRYMLTLGVN